MLRISFSFIFSIFIDCTGVNPMDEEMCLVDGGTTNSIPYATTRTGVVQTLLQLQH